MTRSLSNAPILRFDSVYKSYGPGYDILSDVNVSLAPGSMTVLTGPSGAGKTTLLKMSYLALQPSRGNISLFGTRTSRLRRVQLAELRRQIGIVFQEFRLLDHLSAYENAALPLRVSGLAERQYRDDVIDLLRWVGLGDRLNARPNTLSGGEQQRVAIARAVVGKPSLLIADEPTGNVDHQMGEKLALLFHELNRRLGMTVLVATHDIDLFSLPGVSVLRLSGGIMMRETEIPLS